MSLRVDMTGNSTGFQKMLNDARVQAKAFSNAVTHEVGSSWGGLGKMAASGLAGLLSFEGLRRSIEWFAETGKEIKETAEQIDMSTDSWQKWTSAVGKAGLSLSGFQRVIEALRQKRTEALTDPKARGDLSRLGFSDEQITGDMDMSNFLQLALSNANKGDTQRKYLADIIGSRGLKYATVLPNFSHSDVMFSEEDLKEAEELSSDFKKANRAAGTAIVGLVRFFSGNEKYQNQVSAFWLGVRDAISGRGWLYDKNRHPIDDNMTEQAEIDRRESFFENGYKPVRSRRNVHSLAEQEEISKMIQALPEGTKDAALSIFDFGASSKAELSGNTPKQAASQSAEEFRKNDPLYSQLMKQQEEMALHEQQRQQRLSDSRRDLMNIGDRRDSIRGELGGLDKQISDRKSKMNGEDFLTEADKKELQGVTGIAREMAVNKKRSAYQDTTTDLEVRSEKLTSDLRDKPLKFDADTLSKVGLYSASAAAINPLVGINQKTNQILTEIKNRLPTRPGINKDPHAP